MVVVMVVIMVVVVVVKVVDKPPQVLACTVGPMVLVPIAALTAGTRHQGTNSRPPSTTCRAAAPISASGFPLPPPDEVGPQSFLPLTLLKHLFLQNLFQLL
jgi:hypothetical protein